MNLSTYQILGSDELLRISRGLLAATLVKYDSREAMKIVPEINHLWVRVSHPIPVVCSMPSSVSISGLKKTKKGIATIHCISQLNPLQNILVIGCLNYRVNGTIKIIFLAQTAIQDNYVYRHSYLATGFL